MNSTKPGCNDLQRVCNGNAYSFGAVIESYNTRHPTKKVN